MAKPGPKSSYKPEYCQDLINRLGEGYTIEGFAGSIGKSKDTVFEWLKQHEDFKEAYGIAKGASMYYWEGEFIAAAKSGKGKAAYHIFALTNRSDGAWVNKVLNEHTGSDGGPVVVADLTTAERAKALMAFISKTKAKEEK